MRRSSWLARDVEEGDLVGFLLVVAARHLDGIAGVHVVHVAHALHHAAAVHVEAGDDALQEHAAISSAAREIDGAGVERAADDQRRRARGRTRARARRRASRRRPRRSPGSTPRARARRVASRFGPSPVPSRAMSVWISAATPASSKRRASVERVGLARLEPALRRRRGRRARRCRRRCGPGSGARRSSPARGRAARRCRARRARRRARATPRRAASVRMPPPSSSGTPFAAAEDRAHRGGVAGPAALRAVEVDHVQAAERVRGEARGDRGRDRRRRRSPRRSGPARGARSAPPSRSIAGISSNAAHRIRARAGCARGQLARAPQLRELLGREPARAAARIARRQQHVLGERPAGCDRTRRSRGVRPRGAPYSSTRRPTAAGRCEPAAAPSRSTQRVTSPSTSASASNWLLRQRGERGHAAPARRRASARATSSGADHLDAARPRAPR